MISPNECDNQLSSNTKKEKDFVFLYPHHMPSVEESEKEDEQEEKEKNEEEV